MRNQRLNTQVAHTLVKEVFELLHAGAMQIFEGAVVRGLNHVQQDQLRVEAAGERLNVGGSAAAAVGKIDRKKDFPKLEHDPELYSSLMLVRLRENIAGAREPDIQRGKKKD